MKGAAVFAVLVWAIAPALAMKGETPRNATRGQMNNAMEMATMAGGVDYVKMSGGSHLTESETDQNDLEALREDSSGAVRTGAVSLVIAGPNPELGMEPSHSTSFSMMNENVDTYASSPVQGMSAAGSKAIVEAGRELAKIGNQMDATSPEGARRRNFSGREIVEQSIHERLHEISSAYGLDFSATVFIDGSEAKVTITEGTNSTIVELTTRALRSFLETWISRPSEKDAFVTGLIGCGELEGAQKPNLRDQGVLDRSDAPRTLNHPRMLQALAAAAGVTALMVVGTSVAAHYTA